MSATDIIAEIRRLPREEQLKIAGDFVVNAPKEDFDALVRQRRRAALHALFAHFDALDHPGKKMTEDEIIALSLDADEQGLL